MYCSHCSHQLAPDDVYCPKCATPAASFNFSGFNAAQVEPFYEEQTIVRAELGRTRRLKPYWIAGGALLALVFFLAFGFGFSHYIAEVNRREQAERQAAESREREEAAQREAVRAREAADNERRQREDKIATDAVRSQQADAARRQAENAANAAALATQKSADHVANAALPPDEIKVEQDRQIEARRYAPFDENGKPLRAICKNGEPSYWQHDAWATCMTKGGVRKWIRR